MVVVVFKKNARLEVAQALIERERDTEMLKWSKNMLYVKRWDQKGINSGKEKRVKKIKKIKMIKIDKKRKKKKELK